VEKRELRGLPEEMGDKGGTLRNFQMCMRSDEKSEGKHDQMPMMRVCMRDFVRGLVKWGMV
jgi:hypothetical protein